MAPTLSDIENYWRTAAEKPVDADGLRPTARDPYLQTVVEASIERWLATGSTVFDIGAGDGHSSARFARKAREVLGFDYIPAFVEAANDMAQRQGLENLSFAQADVLNLEPVTRQFGQADIAVTIRCLINLPTWDLQKQAINQIASVVKPGGLYLLSEGWTEGWEALNRYRQKAGLQAVTVVEYNRLISKKSFEDFVSKDFEIVAFESVGFYLYMSRVYQAAYVMPNPPQHRHDINRVSAELFEQAATPPGFEECDYAGVYVLRRR
ncbi:MULTISPECIES: class I SAM-dependent methyltransferase [unclassified Bradyrhizobium]|uniref:class I SAM-dependent methyltransferase n=1 Tax=unclassified Bradyrhizobium TaxID=2631580 RepID=UPI00048C686D|nr:MULTISPECIES: class I SAM-dependent methyltransferase [unclassified Bradyrhizobium]QIG91760.1 methyltransferase domain-containing protein [Bradyrhizobium sp. 6(2017)]